MATASLIQVRCGYSPRFSNNLRNGAYVGPACSTSYAPSSSSCSCCSSQGLNFSSGNLFVFRFFFYFPFVFGIVILLFSDESFICFHFGENFVNRQRFSFYVDFLFRKFLCATLRIRLLLHVCLILQ